MGSFDEFTGPELEISAALAEHLRKSGSELSSLNFHHTVTHARLRVEKRRLLLQPRVDVPRPEIELVVIRGADHRALARRLGDHAYAILITEKSVRNVVDVCHRVLAHADCFTEVGDPKLEVVRGPTLSSIRDNGSDEPGYLPPVPKCEIRRTHAELLAELGLFFLAMHELAHIVQGHLRLPDWGNLPALDQQAAEGAADTYAAVAVVPLVMWMVDTGRLVDDSAGVVAALRATHLESLNILDGVMPSEVDATELSHPLLRRRQVGASYSIRLGYEALQRRQPIKDFRQVEKLERSEQAYRAITGAKGTAEEVQQLSTSDHDGVRNSV